VVLQQVLEVYGSILAGTHWKGCQMGGVSTESHWWVGEQAMMAIEAVVDKN